MNEFKLLCDKIGANWEFTLNGFASYGRIGDSHLNVPGHDGKLVWGNMFSKTKKSYFIIFKNL